MTYTWKDPKTNITHRFPANSPEGRAIAAVLKPSMKAFFIGWGIGMLAKMTLIVGVILGVVALFGDHSFGTAELQIVVGLVLYTISRIYFFFQMRKIRIAGEAAIKTLNQDN